MKYFEAIVEFEVEVQTKNATRVKKNKEVYLVQGDSVTFVETKVNDCLLYTSPSPRDATLSRMPSSA